MVDVTDAAFRSIARDWGADVTCSEMVSAAGINHDNITSWRNVQPWPEGEHPFGVQIMGGDADEVAEAVRRIGYWGRADFVDLNLGCPSPNILRSCAGGFLLRDPLRAGRIIRAAVEAAEQSGIAHVSVKMRLGHDDEHRTFLQVGEEAEMAGASWVTLHGRTVVQGYSGSADWEAIGDLVDHLTIPVVGNGDIRGPEDVLRMREETGCSGFFIARAAMHDPTIFRRLRQALDGQMPEEGPPMEERLDTLMEYLHRAPRISVTHIGELRRQATRFVQGARGAKALRRAIHDAPDASALVGLVRRAHATAKESLVT